MPRASPVRDPARHARGHRHATTTPVIKIGAVRRLGGEVVLFGDGFDAARAHAAELAESTAMSSCTRSTTRCHCRPGHDRAWNCCAASGDIGAIYVPVGGGGLAAGIAAFVKFLRPEIRVIGVEPEEAASMKARSPQAIRWRSTRWGSCRWRGPAAGGRRNLPYLPRTARRHRHVTADEICAAIKDIFDDMRAIAEPAGALALAGLRRQVSGAKRLRAR